MEDGEEKGILLVLDSCINKKLTNYGCGMEGWFFVWS